MFELPPVEVLLLFIVLALAGIYSVLRKIEKNTKKEKDFE